MIVRAIDSYILRHPDGVNRVVSAGDSFDSTDPLVRSHMWAFRSDTDEAPVESASARPGERRNVRIPKK